MLYTTPVAPETAQILVDPLRPRVLAQAGARFVLTAITEAPSTASRHGRQTTLSDQSAIATSVPLSQRWRHVPAVLDPEHPLMGPHPPD